MNEQRRARVEFLFEQIADKPRSEHRHILNAACGDDRDLIRDVEALLEADASSHPLLDDSVPGLASRLLDSTSNEAAIPPRIGCFVPIRFLGQGGMGTVYLAQRDGLGDFVAIKLLRDAWGSPVRRERFASEQRTLAALNHRYIARLYDAGVHNETPWFAMEYVEGASITEHCAIHCCTLEQRLILFRAACEAVSYAHRQFTIHLDLKPSNIFVNLEGDVKLLDFGIAKQLSQAEGVAEQTTAPLRLISINYAAPEQVRNGSVGAETDVHALGVVLYELLTGKLPADLKDADAVELLRRIEQQPERPSIAASVETPDGQRRLQPIHLEPVKASASEWNDLNVLCLKALHKDRSRRYATVADLTRDVEHFLKQEPLEAQPDSVRYSAAKFIKRNRNAVLAASLALFAVAAMAMLFTVRLVAARDEALSSQARTQRIHRLMLNLFEGDDKSAGPTETLRVVTLLDRGVREAQDLQAEPELQAELQQTFGELYHKLGHPDQAEPLLRSALRRRQALLGNEHPDTIRSAIGLSALRADQSENTEAEALAREALSTVEAMTPRPDALFAQAKAALGKALTASGAHAKALPLLEEAVKILEGRPPAPELSEALGDLANTHYYLGLTDAAESTNRRGLSVDRKLYGESHPHVAVGLFNLGLIDLDRGKYQNAEQLFRNSLDITQKWYGQKHPKTASNLLMLGRALQYRKRLDEAASLYQQSLLITEKVYGPEHPRAGMVANHMGMLALDRGRFDEAQSLIGRAASIFKSAMGEQHEFYLHQLSNLGAVYTAKGQLDRAEPILRTAVNRLSTVLSPQHRYTALAQLRLGRCLAGKQRYREAEANALTAYTAMKGQTGLSGEELQSARRELVAIYSALNEPAKAKQFRSELQDQ